MVQKYFENILVAVGQLLNAILGSAHDETIDSQTAKIIERLSR